LHVRNNKKVKFSSPNAFFAERKEIVDESFPGDIVGLHDTGSFKIGDTLTEGEILNFKGIPSFSPEHFRYVNNADPLKSKQLYKGLDQLMDEGVAQLFTMDMNGRKIIGTVGALQYEVLQYRLEHEYGAKCSFTPKRYYKACWMTTNNDEQLIKFIRAKTQHIAKDKDDNYVFLAETPFLLQMAQQDYPDITFHFSSDFKVVDEV
jgi:peptide chain release factor 3